MIIEFADSRSSTIRARQVSSMFDLPPDAARTLRWSGNVDIGKDWNVGLIVGPSGCGKTTVARRLFGDQYHPEMEWRKASVIDDVAAEIAVDDIAAAFGAVGFNTIPAWLRPYAVLSNGEKFRADLARRLLELPDPIVVDEFSSVVDRQVGKIASHAVAKYCRKNNRKFVAVSCHDDIIDWLQPDWIIEPAGGCITPARRSVQPRPRLDVDVRAVPRDTWRLFAPYHYLTSELNTAARCFAAHVDGRPVALAAVAHMPHARRSIKKISRLVTLPDWQGLGLAFVVVDAVASALSRIGHGVFINPGHPALIRSFARSSTWAVRCLPGKTVSLPGKSSSERGAQKMRSQCASCEYVGPKMPKEEAVRFLHWDFTIGGKR